MSIADHQSHAAPQSPTAVTAVYVAWRPGDAAQEWRPVGRLEHADGIYRFWYTRGAERPGFQPFSGMEDLRTVYESEDLFPLFKNRLLSKSRPEYEAFLRWGGFEAMDRPTPLSILGVTEGIRQTDAVEVFPCPEPDAEGCFMNRFFLHGLRWLPDAALERVSRLEPDEQLLLFPDIQNQSDRRAIGVRTIDERMLIGYFPRYLAHDVWELLQRCDVEFLRVSTLRVSPDAPLQNRVLCQLRACWPAGFRPCSSDDFLPLAAR